MEYRFIKTLYEELEGTDLREYREKAYGMIQYAKEKLGGDRFSKYYYNSLVKALKLVAKKYGKKEKLPEKDPEIQGQLRWEKEIKRDQCVFLTFLLMNQEVPLKDRQAAEKYSGDSDKRVYVNLLNRFYKAAGMEILINSSMDQVILCFSLATGQPWESWVDMEAEWREKRKEDKGEGEKYSQWRQLKYADLKARVREGLEVKTLETQNTYLAADKKINEIIDMYNAKAHSLEYKEQEEKITLDNIFPQDIQKVMENTQWRRTWYLYRMLSMAIDSQLKEIIKYLRKWRRTHSVLIKEKFEKAVDDCWLRTNLAKIMSRIPLKLGDKEAEEILMIKFYDSPITVEKIARSFNQALGDRDGSVFVRPQYRFLYYFPEEPERFSSPEDQAEYRYMVHTYFGSDQGIRKILERDSNPAGGNRNARLFCKVMSGEVAATREILLLTALVLKKQGCEELDREYVYGHMLINCRFDTELDKNREFDRFFLDSFGNISMLRHNARKLEMDMLRQGKGAVFYNIITGKEV